MDYILQLLLNPEAWAALVTLVVLEVVLGIDNLIFISVLTNRLPQDQQEAARKLGNGLALILRLALLSLLFVIVGLTKPVINVAGLAFSWRDMILIAGGLFLVWKATTEIHHNVDPDAGGGQGTGALYGFGMVIVQILALDLIFSLDSILTAVGMTDDLPIMVVAVIAAVAVMFAAAEPVARFLQANPTIIMLALSFLLMIGMVLIADGFGVHVPKGYIYAAMAFSALVETLNMMARRARRKRAARAS